MRLPLLIASLLALTLPALAVEMGDDGLHKAPWMRDTFKDLREDLDEANAEGRRLVMIVEQRGCSLLQEDARGGVLRSRSIIVH